MPNAHGDDEKPKDLDQKTLCIHNNDSNCTTKSLVKETKEKLNEAALKGQGSVHKWRHKASLPPLQSLFG